MKRCCCLVAIIRRTKKREKDVGLENILKRIEQGVCHNLLQEIGVDDRGSHFRLFV